MQTETEKAIVSNLKEIIITNHKEIIITNNHRDISKTIIIIIKDSTHSKINVKFQIKRLIIFK